MPDFDDFGKYPETKEVLFAVANDIFWFRKYYELRESGTEHKISLSIILATMEKQKRDAEFEYYWSMQAHYANRTGDGRAFSVM